jgi:NitT/TauT family transport system substrate-binding protein
LFSTPNTEGKPIGWQSEIDWKAALEAMEKANLVKAGWKTEDFFTNDFITN